MTTMAPSGLDEIASTFTPPVLVISSTAGQGMYSLGETIRRKYAGVMRIHHLPIEELLPEQAVAEDLTRYRQICSHCPALLFLVYKVPFFYRRKYLREASAGRTNLDLLRRALAAREIQTVISISHRATFWAGALKRQDASRFHLWGLEAEYGPSLGWRYVFWDQVDGFLSPREDHPYPIPSTTALRRIPIPTADEFSALSAHPGDRNRVLLTGGYWGLGPLLPVASGLVRAMPGLRIEVVCGDNQRLYQRLRSRFLASPAVSVFGAVDSLLPFLERAGAVITKPGIATLAEAHAARRQLFLLRGLPVAEDHNARHAIRHFGARRYSLPAFSRWHHTG